MKEKKAAPSRVVMSEVGSLSVEFTRLAQITGDNKYFDAIQRVMDEMEAFQDKSPVKGMWPQIIDISGCDQVTVEVVVVPATEESSNTKSTELKKEAPPSVGDTRYAPSVGKVSEEDLVLNPPKVKRQAANSDRTLEDKYSSLQVANGMPPPEVSDSTEDVLKLPAQQSTKVEPPKPRLTTMCRPKANITRASESGQDKFSLGGMADSTYEYLMKVIRAVYFITSGLTANSNTCF